MGNCLKLGFVVNTHHCIVGILQIFHGCWNGLGFDESQPGVNEPSPTWSQRTVGLAKSAPSVKNSLQGTLRHPPEHGTYRRFVMKLHGLLRDKTDLSERNSGKIKTQNAWTNEQRESPVTQKVFKAKFNQAMALSVTRTLLVKKQCTVHPRFMKETSRHRPFYVYSSLVSWTFSLRTSLGKSIRIDVDLLKKYRATMTYQEKDFPQGCIATTTLTAMSGWYSPYFLRLCNVSTTSLATRQSCYSSCWQYWMTQGGPGAPL